MASGFKLIQYFFYTVYTRLKGIKYEAIKKFKGEEAATTYAMKSITLWAEFTIRIIGIDLVVEGKENIPEGPCVFIGNHTSILDIPSVYSTAGRGIGFVSKMEMLKTPVIGYWIKRARCIALDRQNPRDAIKMINEGVQNLKAGYSMMIFPEGTRSLDGRPGEFKKGSMKLATKAKVPIVPVAIDGAFKSFEKDRKFQPSKIKVTYCKAIHTNNLTKDEEKLLSERVRQTIVEKLSEEYR